MRTPLRPRGGAGAGGGGSGSSPQAVARYLVGLRPLLVDACEERGEWVRELGRLIEQARSGNALRVSRGAGELGRSFGDRFRLVRSKMDLLRPPPECDLCHASVRAWAEALHRSCAALAEVGRTGHLGGLREAQERLADARVQARRFNDEYARLSNDLRRRVAVARRHTAAMPTRRQGQPS